MARKPKAKGAKTKYTQPRLSGQLNDDEMDKVSGGGCGSGFETCTDGGGAVGACNAGPQIRPMPVCHAGMNDRYGCHAGAHAGQICAAGQQAVDGCQVGA